MSIESLLAMTGLGQFVDQDFFLAQIGLLGGSALLFLFSLALCIMAFRAAKAAKSARGESEAYFESAQDLAKEMRHLTAQVEKTMSGEPSFLENATSGIAAASVPPEMRMDTEGSEAASEQASELEKSHSAEPAAALVDQDSKTDLAEKEPKKTQKRWGRSPRASDDTLAFVDSDETLTKDAASNVTAIDEGAVCELVDDPKVELSEEAQQGNSPLSRLLRRRRS